MKMHTLRKAALAASLSAIALLPAQIATAEDAPVVRFQAVAGSIGAIPLMIVEHENLDEKYGFEGKFDFLGMSGGFQSFLVGNYDVTNDEDIIGLSAARAEGFNVRAFYPNGTLYLGIVVPGDSKAKTVEDLKGKRVGHFGMDSGTTTFLRVAIQDGHHFDLSKEYDLQQVGPAALPPLLEKGDVEAIFNFEPFVSEAMVKTGGHYLMQASEAYRQQYDGFSPWIGSWAAKEEWLKENPKLAYGVRDALEEANKRIIDSKYEILREPYIAEALGVTDAKVLDKLIENGRTYGYFTTEWTPELIGKASEFLARIASEKIVIEEAPEGVMVVLEDFVGPRPQ